MSEIGEKYPSTFLIAQGDVNTLLVLTEQSKT